MQRDGVSVISDEEFESLERGFSRPMDLPVEVLQRKIEQLLVFGRYWRDQATKDPEALREMQSREVG